MTKTEWPGPDSSEYQKTKYFEQLHACMEKNAEESREAAFDASHAVRRVQFDSRVNLSVLVMILLAICGSAAGGLTWLEHVNGSLNTLVEVVSESKQQQVDINQLKTDVAVIKSTSAENNALLNGADKAANPKGLR